ncbi:hypothetical protein FOZ63_030671 [Perkinsus olseni]|uniref:Uncharacterized protein n=1 Tax=Perkinsus olseni TaxID=32597 RepID=A0A7J6SXD0_PEROL|nr:hypothetical protein FOZ63_030671 [Perkinsus olseni]
MPRLSIVIIFLLHCLLFYKGYATVGSSNEDESLVRRWLTDLVNSPGSSGGIRIPQGTQTRHQLNNIYLPGVQYQLGEDKVTVEDNGQLKNISILTDFAWIESVYGSDGSESLRYTAISDEEVMRRFSANRVTNDFFLKATSDPDRKGDASKPPRLRKSLKEHLTEGIHEQIKRDYESLKNSRRVCRVTSTREPYLPLTAYGTPQIEVESELTLTMRSLEEGFRLSSLKAELRSGNIRDFHFYFDSRKLRDMHAHAGVAPVEPSEFHTLCVEQLKLFAKHVAHRCGINFNTIRRELYAELVLMWLTERSFVYPRNPRFANDLTAPHVAGIKVRMED